MIKLDALHFYRAPVLCFYSTGITGKYTSDKMLMFERPFNQNILLSQFDTDFTESSSITLRLAHGLTVLFVSPLHDPPYLVYALLFSNENA